MSDNRVKFRDPRFDLSGEIRPKAVGLFDCFSNFDKCRPEVACDIIPSVAIGFVGSDIRAKLGDFRLNSGQIIRLFGWPHPFYTLFAVKPKMPGFVVERVGMDVKLGDPKSNRSIDIFEPLTF